MITLVKYWKPILAVFLVAITALGYWMNIQTAKEVGAKQIQLELMLKKEQRDGNIEKSITDYTNSVSDELRYLRDRKGYQE